MDDIEKRARELLAQASGWGVDDIVEHLRSDLGLFTAEEALDAVRAALTPPEGYVLVPVEPTREMIDAYVSVDSRFNSARHDWAVMIAARPEAP